MKLLNLRFSNLNSLYGEWSIDFEHRDYVANGLFAITGPTGAGKSTVLDAISLALYGKTPRLGTITNSVNEIMSRDCGECFAEVTFQSSKGKYRAHWSQRRARSKASGNLQAPQHELVDAVKDQVITAKKIETLLTIQEYVGLDYEQFMRSIMLAQGEFATFLKSEDSKRASILAKITGTDIYARIGTAVYQRFQSESSSLDSIAIQSSTIELLSEQAIIALNARIQEIDASLEKLNATRMKTDLALRWLERFDQFQCEMIALREACTNAKLAVDTSLPLRRQFDRAQRALPFQRSLESLTNLQSRIVAAENLLKEKRVELADAESCKAKTFQWLEHTKREMKEIQTAIELSRPIWLATRDLDLQIANTMSHLESTLEQSRSIDLNRQRLLHERLNLDFSSKEAQDKLTQTRSYQEDHHFDAELSGLLPKFEYLVAEYRAKSEQIWEAELQLSAISIESSQIMIDRSAANERLTRADREVQDRQAEIATIESRRLTTLAGNSVDALQGEAEAIRDSQQALLDNVRTIESILLIEAEKRSELAESHTLKQAILENQSILTGIEKHIEQQKQLVAALEASYFKDQLIAELHVHRARLVAGQPCELCGSADHPWANSRKALTIGETELALKEAKERLSHYIDDRETAIRLCDRSMHLLSRTEEAIHTLEESMKLEISECKGHAERFGLDSAIESSTVESSRQSLERLKNEEAALRSRISDANAALELVAKKREELTEIVAGRSTAEQALQTLATAEKHLEESSQRSENDIAQDRDLLRSKQEELAKILERLRLAWPEDLSTILVPLNARSKAWMTSLAEAAKMEKDLLLIDGRIASLVPQSDQLDIDWKTLQNSCVTQSTDLESLHIRRKEIFGSRDPQEAEHELKTHLDQKSGEGERLTSEYEPMIAAWHLLDRQVLQIASSRSTDAEQLLDQKKKLEVDLQAANFADLQDFESAIHPQSEIEEWSRQLQSMDEVLSAADVRLAQKAIEHDAWNEKRASHATKDLLQQELNDADCSIEALRCERIELQHQISENQTKVERLQGAHLRLATQQKQVERWSVLNELIGSADGGKFRRFAQGITFELLLAYANIQLAKLTDRYLLKKGEEGLSLVVVDHYQSSRSRSAANLSGGETFLVSLALALGLSKLASQNVQIDSLFLDEGFGTLDEETLEEALHTLANLRQEGKLVGLISHVAALNQQVPVRIEVLKGSMGRSRLVGPGVK